MTTCYSYYWHECGKDTASMACKIDAARNASIRACAQVATELACDAEDACYWSSGDSACRMNYIGTLLVYKQLGSKIAAAYTAQWKTCISIRKKRACLASPPRQSATTSYARGKACDWFGGDDGSCGAGTEFGSLLYASADNDIDR
jgi:hypothetical protein